MVLGDFNLHHPLWCGPRNPAAHQAADIVVEALLEKDMELATPQGMITWEAKDSTSTIDLAFISQLL